MHVFYQLNIPKIFKLKLYFLWYWGLNFGPLALQARPLPLDPNLSPKFTFLNVMSAFKKIQISEHFAFQIF
jgi:hypothetical protein